MSQCYDYDFFYGQLIFVVCSIMEQLPNAILSIFGCNAVIYDVIFNFIANIVILLEQVVINGAAQSNCDQHFTGFFISFTEVLQRFMLGGK